LVVKRSPPPLHTLAHNPIQGTLIYPNLRPRTALSSSKATHEFEARSFDVTDGNPGGSKRVSGTKEAHKPSRGNGNLKQKISIRYNRGYSGRRQGMRGILLLLLAQIATHGTSASKGVCESTVEPSCSSIGSEYERSVGSGGGSGSNGGSNVMDQQLAKEAYKLGLTQADKGDFKSAEISFKKATQLNPKYADAFYQVGVTRASQRDLPDCEKWVSKAIELDSTIAPYHSLLGVCSVQQGKLDNAKAAFQKAVELVPEDPYSHYNLGMVLERMGDLAGAEEAYLSALTLKADKRFHQRMARVLDRAGELKRALLYYENVLKFDAADEEAKARAAAIELLLGKK